MSRRLNIVNNKYTYTLLLMLVSISSLSLLVFKYYYWYIVDQSDYFPEYGFWPYFVIPFIVLFVVSFVYLLRHRFSILSYMPLLICVLSLITVLYVPYAVLYKDVYDAFYDDGHEERYDKYKMLDMLKNKEFLVLEEYLDKLHNIQSNESNKESLLADAYKSFGLSTAKDMGGDFDAWVVKTGSFQALTARAYFLASKGWRIRGTKYLSKTSEKNIAQMRQVFIDAIEDLKKSVSINPYNVPAYCKLIETYGVIGETYFADEIMAAALSLYPSSYYVRYYYMSYHLEPRWGGSINKMMKYAMDARAYAAKNPRLMALSGFVYQQLALDNQKPDHKLAMDQISKALQYAPLSSFYLTRANIYKKHSDLNNELAQYDEILKKTPNQTTALIKRSVILTEMQRFDEAAQDAKRAIKYKRDVWVGSKAGWVFEFAKEYDLALKAYKLSIRDDPKYAYPYERVIALYINNYKDTQSALKTAIEMTIMMPDYSMGWLYAADYMYDLKMDEAITYIEKYFELVNKDQPKSKEIHEIAIQLLKDIQGRHNVKKI